MPYLSALEVCSRRLTRRYTNPRLPYLTLPLLVTAVLVFRPDNPCVRNINSPHSRRSVLLKKSTFCHQTCFYLFPQNTKPSCSRNQTEAPDCLNVADNWWQGSRVVTMAAASRWDSVQKDGVARGTWLGWSLRIRHVTRPLRWQRSSPTSETVARSPTKIRPPSPPTLTDGVGGISLCAGRSSPFQIESQVKYMRHRWWRRIFFSYSLPPNISAQKWQNAAARIRCSHRRPFLENSDDKCRQVNQDQKTTSEKRTCTNVHVNFRL